MNEDVERYLNDQRARGASAIVSELRDYFDEVIEHELRRREHDLDGLDAGQREVVASIVR